MDGCQVFRQGHTGQATAAGEQVPVDPGNAVRNGDLSQSRTVLERMVIHIFQPIGQTDFGQTTAAVKGISGNGLQRAGQGNLGKIGELAECVRCNLGNAFRHCKAGQLGAAVEGTGVVGMPVRIIGGIAVVVQNGGQGHGIVCADKVRAVIERSGRDRCDTVGQLYRSKTGTALECIGMDGCQAVGQIQARQTGTIFEGSGTDSNQLIVKSYH